MTCERLEKEDLLADLGGELDAHVASCAECQARLSGYRVLADFLGAGASSHRPAADFVARTMARIRAVERRRRAVRWAAGAGVALAAGLVLWLLVGRKPRPPELTQLAQLSVEVVARGTWREDPAVAAGRSARPGDEVRAIARAGGAPYFELRVYRGEELVARCPAEQGGACRDEGKLLVWTAPSVGTYQLLLWVSSRPIAAPRGALAADQRAALEAGARLVDVAPLQVR